MPALVAYVRPIESFVAMGLEGATSLWQQAGRTRTSTPLIQSARGESDSEDDPLPVEGDERGGMVPADSAPLWRRRLARHYADEAELRGGLDRLLRRGSVCCEASIDAAG
jgi:hypothetical protein